MTFKENCPDLRNSKVIDIVRELQSFGVKVHVHDPVAQSDECEHEYGIALTPWDALPKAQAMVAAVAHREYLDLGLPRLTEPARARRRVRGREVEPRAGGSRRARLLRLAAVTAA